MKIKSHKGFTLIELLIAAMTGIILIISAGIVLSFGHRLCATAWKRTNLQRDASYAMLKMSRHIKAAKSAQTENNDKAIKICKDITPPCADWIRFFLDGDNNDLKCQPAGQPTETVISGFVEDLEFTIDPNDPKKVEIKLNLSNGDVQIHFVSSAMIRNYVE